LKKLIFYFSKYHYPKAKKIRASRDSFQGQVGGVFSAVVRVSLRQSNEDCQTSFSNLSLLGISLLSNQMFH
jgi:hypothetical protein